MSYQSKCRVYFENRLKESIDKDRKRCAQINVPFQERDVTSPFIRDIFAAILDVQTKDVAQKFYTGFVAWLEKMQEREGIKSQMTPVEVAKENIGWCYGQGMSQHNVDMWVEVCGAKHPVFGTKIPSPEEAFRLGKEYADRMEQEAINRIISKAIK